MAIQKDSNKQYAYYRGKEKPEAEDKRLTLLRYGFLVFCIAGFIVLPWMYLGIQPDPRTPDSMKGEEQAKALEEHHKWENDRLNNYDWADREKNIIRIPIDKAMEMSLQGKFPVRKKEEPSNQTENK